MKRVLRVPLIIAVVGLLLIAGSVSALALTIHTETQPDRGGSYVEGVVGAPISPNPLLASFNDADRDIASLVFTGLARLNERGEPIPDLARHWQVGVDGKTVVIALRRDAHWHDGAPFGALDVLYTVRTIQSPKFPGSPDLAEAWKGITVEAIDDYTVRFRLRDSFAPFLMNLTVGMLPSHILKDVPPDALPDHPYRSNPIGTGPFKVREASSDAVTLDANPGYYGEKPYLRTIKFQFYPNRQALLNAIKTREITAAAHITAQDLAAIGKHRDYAVYTASRASYTILFLNHSSPFFRDRAVRQALAYAIDRRKVVETAVRGHGVIADTPIPPGSWAAITTTMRYDFNPALANKMLEDAGWRIGVDGIRERDGSRFSFHLMTNDDPTRVRAAEEVSRQLRAIGIRAEVSASGYSGLIERFLAPRNFEAVLFGLDPGGDPDGFANWHSSQSKGGGFNFIGYSNRRVDELLEKARSSGDPLERLRMYTEFQSIFMDDEPSIILYYPTLAYAVDRNVNGVTVGMIFEPADRFRYIANWHVRTKRSMVMTPPRWP